MILQLLINPIYTNTSNSKWSLYIGNTNSCKVFDGPSDCQLLFMKCLKLQHPLMEIRTTKLLKLYDLNSGSSQVKKLKACMGA